jgi:hypothetical protein
MYVFVSYSDTSLTSLFEKRITKFFGIPSDLVPFDPQLEKIDQRMVDIALDMPPEFKALAQSHALFLPVVVIMSRSCRLLPHPLPPEYGYSYLGLFRIIKMDVSLFLFYIEPCSPFDCSRKHM